MRGPLESNDRQAEALAILPADKFEGGLTGNISPTVCVSREQIQTKVFAGVIHLQYAENSEKENKLVSIRFKKS